MQVVAGRALKEQQAERVALVEVEREEKPDQMLQERQERQTLVVVEEQALARPSQAKQETHSQVQERSHSDGTLCRNY
jgi:hypothetical protein